MAMIRPKTEMKDSGIEYLGKIPTTWGKCRLKNVCTSFNSNITTAIINKEHGNYKIFGASGLIGYIEFETMQDEYLGIVKDGAGVGRIGSYPSHSSLLGTLAYIIPNDGINMKWIKYVIENMNLGESIDKTTIPHIYFSTYGNNYIPFPSPDEQRAIADYLDKTCFKIDEIIAEAKASIDEYKELKIGQINKYTIHKMKRTKLKYITEKIGDGIHATPEYSDEGTIRFINGGSFGEDSIKMIGPMLSNEEYQKQNKSLLNEHTVMIALNGANFGNTSLYNNEAILLGKSAGYITLKSTVCREYVRYCLENSVTKEAFDLSLNGTTIPNLSLNTLRNTEICLPDYSVQKQLARTIKKMIIKMDSLIAEKESLINDLEAYKKSLIYEVVTGKRRVV